MSQSRALETAVERLDRVHNMLAVLVDRDGLTVLERLRALTVADALKAARYDQPQSDPELWCDDHDQEFGRCARLGRGCGGTPIVRPSDPTGESVARRSEADEAVAVIDNNVDVIEQVAVEFEDIWRRFSLVDPGKAREEAERLTEDNERGPRCTDCHAHIGKYSAPHTVEPSNIGGRLTVKVLLCRWHTEWVTRTGSRATTAVTMAASDGGRGDVGDKRLTLRESRKGIEVITHEGSQFVDWVPGSRKKRKRKAA